jgi:bifunctional UDP-N-acetylglucosamine pyrophosphorylase/glucosamine-1-phosphate N-acetyltransferase
MLPIANKPILEHLLVQAEKAGIKEFIFIVGYRDEQVRDYFGEGDRWGVTIDYVTQRKQLGTADALKMVESAVDEDFLMINGDIIVGHKDIAGLADHGGNIMSLVEVEDTVDLGLVEVNGDRVVHIYEKVEKPPSHLANAGLYLFTSGIFQTIFQTPKSPRGELEITDSIQLLIDQGQDVSCHKIDYWLDISYPWDLLSTNASLLAETKAENLGEIEENVVIKGIVSIGKGTTARSGSYIIGPVVIGRDCEIGPNCYIRPHTSIGHNCHIGAAVEIKNSIIMDGSKIPHHNYVGDSIIGEECNLGAGTKIANLRLDKKDILVAGKDTKMRKMGAIIGDSVETGINASINVGSVIGNNTQIGPGAVVSGVIAPNSRLF